MRDSHNEFSNELARINPKVSSTRNDALENGQNISSKIDSDRYIIDEIIDKGEWGVICNATDKITGFELVTKSFSPSAIAELQRKYRALTPRQAILKEVPEVFGEGSNLVQRWVEEDKNGNLFLIMKKYERNLQKEISRIKSGFAKDFTHLSRPAEMRYFKEMLKGVRDYHKEFNAPHLDLKLENYLIDKKGNIDLTDYGSSILGMSGESPKDDISNIFTRAPEISNMGVQPSIRADDYQICNVLLKMMTGRTLLESELANAKDQKEFVNSLDEEVHETIKKKRLNDIPDDLKTLKRFLKKGLSYDPKKRFKSDEQMLQMYDEAIENITVYKRILNQMKWWAIPAFGIAAGVSLVIHTSRLPEPKPLENEVKQGVMYTSSGLPYKLMLFQRDTIIEGDNINNYMVITDNALRHCTSNSYVAHLLKTYRETLDGVRYSGDMMNEHQDKILKLMNYDPEKDENNDYRYLIGVAKCIEYGISKAYIACADSSNAQTNFGVVDLEDACVIACLGEESLSKAKNLAGSNDFKKYGEFLPEQEASFINSWMSRLRLE
ncbi:MAG: protein kinase domain-containing protein [Candidatus Nanoarchaeia archaeon]